VTSSSDPQDPALTSPEQQMQMSERTRSILYGLLFFAAACAIAVFCFGASLQIPG
jgi:hypothetical protein